MNSEADSDAVPQTFPSSFGLKGFASAAAINFASAVSTDPEPSASQPRPGVDEDRSSSDSDSSKSSESSHKRRKRHKRESKHRRKHDKRRKHKRSKSRDRPVDNKGEDGLYIIDTEPDRHSVSFGTVLDAPIFKSRDACVSLRHMIGAGKLSGMEREWLTTPAHITRALDPTVQYQIAGVVPTKPPKSEKWKSHTGRYYIPGAIPARPKLNLSRSTKRLQRQRQTVVAAAAAAQRESQYVESQQKSAQLAQSLAASLGVKVISYTGASSVTPAANVKPTANDYPGTFSGFIPMDPPGVDPFGEDPDDISNDAFKLEQLALRSEGLLTPAFGETIAEFVKRRSRELNEATRDRSHDENVWLELAAFQPIGIDSGAGPGVKLRRRDALVVDKQIAVYEKGLQHCPRSLRLAKALIRASTESLTREQMEDVWKVRLAAQPAEPTLWLDFMSYVTSLYSTFTVPALKHVTSNALSTIQSVQRAEAAADRAKGVFVFEAGLLSAHSRRRAAMLAVFNSFVATARACGHTELAVALYQSLIEFNCNTPSEIAREPLATRLQYFEAYWESDYQRIGDVSAASGWSHWLSQRLAGVDEDAAISDSSTITSTPTLPTEREQWGLLGVDETIGYFKSLEAAEAAASSALTDVPAISSPETDAPDGARIELVYSALHGYRIPMRIESESSETSSMYEKILGELRDESGSIAAATAKAEKRASKILKPSRIPEDDPLVAWLKREDEATAQQTLPLRSCDISVTSSTVQIVTFERLAGLVFEVGKDMLGELIQHTLATLGICLNNRHSTCSSDVQYGLKQATNPADVIDISDAALALSPFTNHSRDMRWAVHCVTSTLSAITITSPPHQLRFILNMFQCLLAMGVLASSPLLLCAYFEFSAAYGQTTDTMPQCRDAVKSILSQPQHSSDLRLWLSYSAFENTCGNVAESKRVLERAVGLSTSLPIAQSRHRFLLWSALACASISTQIAEECAHILCGSIEDSPFVTYTRAIKKADGGKVVSPTRVLKARTAFHQVWRSEVDSCVAAVKSLCVSWVKACANASGAAPDITSFVSAVATPPAPTQLLLLTDIVSGSQSVASPYAAFCLCYALFEYCTQGFDAACAAMSRSVIALKAFAASILVANSGQIRRDSMDDVMLALDKCVALIDDDPNNIWVSAFASVGRSKVTQPSHVDDVILSAFPIDTTDGVARIVDSYLRDAEWLTVWWTQLTYHHNNTVSPVPPRITRHLLEQSLNTFPNNTLLLSLYTRPQRHVLHATVRIRQTLDRFTRLIDCPAALWPQLLYSELQHASESNEGAPEFASVQHITRLFEQAVSASASSVLLWRMYVRFLLVTGNAAGAKRVLFRSIHNCPASVAVWADAVRRLRPYFETDELAELLRVMVQKGLAVRTPLHT